MPLLSPPHRTLTYGTVRPLVEVISLILPGQQIPTLTHSTHLSTMVLRIATILHVHSRTAAVAMCYSSLLSTLKFVTHHWSGLHGLKQHLLHGVACSTSNSTLCPLLRQSRVLPHNSAVHSSMHRIQATWMSSAVTDLERPLIGSFNNKQ